MIFPSAPRVPSFHFPCMSPKSPNNSRDFVLGSMRSTHGAERGPQYTHPSPPRTPRVHFGPEPISRQPKTSVVQDTGSMHKTEVPSKGAPNSLPSGARVKSLHFAPPSSKFPSTPLSAPACCATVSMAKKVSLSKGPQRIDAPSAPSEPRDHAMPGWPSPAGMAVSGRGILEMRGSGVEVGSRTSTEDAPSGGQYTRPSFATRPGHQPRPLRGGSGTCTTFAIIASAIGQLAHGAERTIWTFGEECTSFEW
mmetsp:Transcript_51187/g.164379  ORF Transcript_51187/g.164379 Transcript_51187/m.164379 type:complete len:251 (+) Transcript_51187:435-1187(+)